MLNAFKAPLEMPPIEVQPDWIDYNNHMNGAFFLVAFDKGVDAFLDLIGVTPSYIEKQQASPLPKSWGVTSTTVKKNRPRALIQLETHCSPYLQALVHPEPDL